MNEILDRIPPSDSDAERQLIGSLLLDPSMLDEVLDVISPDDFRSDANSVLFGHLCGMARVGMAIDTPMLVDRLRTTGDLERIGGMAYLAEAVQSVAVAAHAVHYATIVARTSKLRAIISVCTDILVEAYQNPDPEVVLRKASSAIQRIEDGHSAYNPVSMAAVVQKVLERLEESIATGRGFGIPTGFQKIDEVTGGLFRGELTVIGARPSQGKSAMLGQIAIHNAKRGRRVYMACLEMADIEVVSRMLYAESGVDGRLFRNGKATREHVGKIQVASNAIADATLFIDDRPVIRPYDIERMARKLKADLVCVDYLQLVEPDERDRERLEQMRKMTRALKQMPRRLNIPVVVAAQLNRAAAGPKEVPPSLHNLRESGTIEQDADNVWLIFRPKEKLDGWEWDAEIDIAKQRNGQTSVYKMDWRGGTTEFECHGQLHLPPSGVWSADNELPVVDDF